MKSEKLKIGIIGLGIGARHIEAYASHKKCEVIKICDFNEKKLNAIATLYPEIKKCKDSLEVIKDPEIDVVSIASYDNYHYAQIKDSIINNKHVFVEKPMCLFKNEAVIIRKLLNKNPHIHLSSNLVLRTCPRFVALKKTIASGKLGNIYHIQADYLWGRIFKLLDGWRKNMDYYSIVLGASIHMIDLVLWLTDMKPLEVIGRGNKIATDNSEMKYDDFAVSLLKFKNNLIAEIKSHGGCVHPHFHNVNVFGTKKTFMSNYIGAKWIESCDFKKPLKDIKEEYPGKANRTEIITTFIDSILNGKIKPIVSKDEVFDTLSVCFAAEEAIKKNKSVKINYL